MKNYNYLTMERSVNKSEEIVRRVMEMIFNMDFPVERPDWLAELQLDGFNEKAKIAFEYNGEQHYSFIKHFHSTIESFKKRLRYDKIKKFICRDRGVRLYVIPTLPTGSLKEKMLFVATEIIEQERTFTDNLFEKHMGEELTRTQARFLTKSIAIIGQATASVSRIAG